MTPKPTLTPLFRAQSMRLHGPQRVLARHGTLWITVDGDAEDLVLEAGSSVLLGGRSPALVTALGGDAEVCATHLAPATLGQRLRHAWHAATHRGGGRSTGLAA
jgi:hypothetical protein